jgi:hypothetical protein
MKKYIIPGLMALGACGGLALSSVAFSGLASSTVEAVIAIRDQIKRSVAIFEAPVNPTLPNVLIIGDSISISYILPVRQRLEGIANVIRPVANCD